MTQSDLNRAVAQATGETVHTIRQLGFVPLHEIPYEREHWDDRDAKRNMDLTPRRRRTPAVA